MRRLATLTFAGVLALVLVACGAPAPERQSIAATADELGDFTTLLTLLAVYDLDEVFADDAAGPFTVFAPTDDAFDAFLGGAGAAQPSDANDPVLTTLLYHVVSGRLAPQVLLDAGALGTLADLPLCFAAAAGSVTVNGATNVVAGPIQATNGTIYAVDTVLDPFDSIAGSAIAAPDFDVLVQAVIAADLVEPLVCGGPFTVFAPTDEAFGNLLAELGVTADDLLSNVDLVTEVLLYHVVPGALEASDVVAAVTAGGGSVDVTTLQGQAITVTAPEGVVLNGDVNVIATDVLARNGVIHVIDAVLLPASD